MLKERVKKLLIYCIVFTIIMQSLCFSLIVNATSSITIIYEDYITGDTIYKNIIPEDTSPTIYQDTTGNYPIWINSETEEILKEEDLKDGLIVYGISNKITIQYSSMRDFWGTNGGERIVWQLENNNINKLSDINYKLLRGSTYPENKYPFVVFNNEIYRTACIPVTKLKAELHSQIFLFNPKIQTIIYDGTTGQPVDVAENIYWCASTINGIEINDNINYYGVLQDDSMEYKLQMSDIDKEKYPNLFVPKGYDSNVESYWTLYDNQTYKYHEAYGRTGQDGIGVLISVNQCNHSSATCTHNGEKEYVIEYDFSSKYVQYKIDGAIYYNISSSDDIYNYIDIVAISNNDYSSAVVHRNNKNNTVYFDYIESFDEFANPYLLKKYGIHQYERLHISGDYCNFYLEIFPTYENGKTYYNIHYNNDLNDYITRYDTEWDNKLKFDINNPDDVVKYNQWVDTLPVINNKHCMVFNQSSLAEYFVVANQDNPYETLSDSSLETQINAMKFTLTANNDNITTVASTFLKTNSKDKLYIEGDGLYSGPNIVYKTYEDALGHKWDALSWTEVDVNNISNNTDIINANSNVVDLNSLLEYAENDIDASLLNGNNKLYYKLCSKAGDAYELEVKHVHTYNEPTFTWNEGYSDCEAKFECVDSDDVKTLDCAITSKKIEPNCTKDGKIIYTATVQFNNQVYTDTKEVTIKALGHDFGSWYEVKAPTYGEDGLLQRDCIRNDKSETKPIDKLIKTAIVSGVLKDENGKPIANKKVEIHSNPRYTYTDENGYFEFKDVELGEHTLKVFNTDNKIICELALTLDKIESNVEEKQVDKNFKWDKEINESDVSLTIDGLKVEKPTEKPTEAPTEPTTEETTTKEPVTEEETTTEKPTKPIIETTTKEETTEEETTTKSEETIAEETTNDEMTTEETSIPKTDKSSKDKSSGPGIETLGWLAAILVGAGIILVVMGKKKLIAYEYIFELIEKDEYKGKIIKDARVIIAIKPFKDNEEVRLKKEPIIKNNPDVRFSDIVNISLDENRLPVLNKSLEIENLYKDIFGWDLVEFEVIGYALGYEGTLTAEEYNNTPEELRESTVIDVMKASKIEFEAVATGRLKEFDGNVQMSTMLIE